MTFAYPWVLAGLVLLPLTWWMSGRRKRPAAVMYSETRLLRSAARKGRGKWLWLPPLFWLLAAVFSIIALARPQERNVRQEIVAPGIDIVLALDMSTSMLADDFRPNRFEAAKTVISRFISSRSTDRVGLTVFAGRAYSQVPLTFDYRAVQQLLQSLEVGQIEDGTAIGMGMVESLNRLKVSDAKSKVIILLTDGVNNRGQVDPETAGEIAKRKGIRVYTIGMGVENRRLSAMERMMGGRQEATVNTDLLRKIAEETGGRYFEAATLQDLSAVYDTIGKLEKSEVKLNEFVTIQERFPQALQLALTFFLLGWLMELTWLRKIP